MQFEKGVQVGKRFPFPRLPNGWYAVALADEVKPGELISRHYFSKEIVIYRTQSGVVRVIDAFCPHMGAHLGKLGEVKGERLRCGFHGFTYDGSGRCVATSYDGNLPQKAQLRLWDVREQNGLVLVWFDPDERAATWEIPALADSEWIGLRWRRFRIATHPQETTENSVDFGHFTQIHSFVEASVTREVDTDGPLLTMSYRAHRPLGVPGLPKYRMPFDYDIKVWGLGYSQVDVRVDTIRFGVRIWVLPVPLDEDNIDLVLGVSTPRRLGPFARIGRFITYRILCEEVEQDRKFWAYKTYVETPPLAKGDGPVIAYRRYAQQFYAPPKDVDADAS